MSDAEIWLDSLLSSGGDRVAPPPTIIPSDYLPNPRRKPLRTIGAPNRISLQPSRGLKRSKNMENLDTPRPSSPSKRRRLSDDPNITPIPIRRQHHVMAGGVVLQTKISKPSGGKITDEGYAESESSASTNALSKKSSRRSQSPTKRMIDLRVADKGVVHRPKTFAATLPTKAKELHLVVHQTAEMPIGIVPKEIKDEFETICSGTEPCSSYAFNTHSDPRAQHDIWAEYSTLVDVRNDTHFCTTKHVSEPSWNERVHCKMLREAVRNAAGLEYHNITTAKVIKELVPDNQYDQVVKKKMVDYAIVLSEPLVPEYAVVAKLKSSPALSTVNQTDYAPLCHEPIAISIETKTPNGNNEESLVQLSVWASAHFNRLRSLLPLSQEGFPIEVALPIVSVSGEQWHLKFALDRHDTVEIIESAHLGSTDTLLGCYKVLAGLQKLIAYAVTTYKVWLTDVVLAPE